MNHGGTIDRSGLVYRQSTSAVVVGKNGRVVIVQKNSYKDDEWDIPGGGVDPGETPERTILRELKEELGSDKFKIVKVSQRIYKYDWSDELITRRIGEGKAPYRGQERVQFLIEFGGEEEEIDESNDELRRIKWVSVDELESYLIFPDQYQGIRALLEEFGISIR